VDAIVRLVGAILLKQNDEWNVERCRYMTPIMTPIITPSSDGHGVKHPELASRPTRPMPVSAVIHRQLHHFPDTILTQ